MDSFQITPDSGPDHFPDQWNRWSCSVRIFDWFDFIFKEQWSDRLPMACFGITSCCSHRMRSYVTGWAAVRVTGLQKPWKNDECFFHGLSDSSYSTRKLMAISIGCPHRSSPTINLICCILTWRSQFTSQSIFSEWKIGDDSHEGIKERSSADGRRIWVWNWSNQFTWPRTSPVSVQQESLSEDESMDSKAEQQIPLLGRWDMIYQSTFVIVLRQMVDWLVASLLIWLTTKCEEHESFKGIHRMNRPVPWRTSRWEQKSASLKIIGVWWAKIDGWFQWRGWWLCFVRASVYVFVQNDHYLLFLKLRYRSINRSKSSIIDIYIYISLDILYRIVSSDCRNIDTV